ncbi:MAG: RCC1 repeat-containing protein, partial [Deltaproteobacteria bacterium]|nr:RCC1 repeat-containing protein [Deltaproteobacteria bacterium]
MRKLVLFSILFLTPFYASLAGRLAGGEFHSLAMKEDGTVWGWGWNLAGQLGDGTTENRHTPVQAIGLNNVISVSAGGEHSLAVKRDGTAWGWGSDSWGQLGQGLRDMGFQNNGVPGVTTPRQVSGLSQVIDVAAGVLHSLFLISDGTVWACGGNRYGQLGNGTLNDSSVPVRVVGLSNVVAIASGPEHSLAVENDGTVWAWGENNTGQLGDGTICGWTETCYSAVPVQAVDLSNVVAIVGRGGSSLALKNDGTVWNWGGERGSWFRSQNSATFNMIPQQSSLSGVIAIHGANGYSLALTSYGAVLLWGELVYGISSQSPAPVNGLSGVTAIAGGDYHALALKNDGTVWALGWNDHGELGDSTTTFRSYPVQVQGLSLSALSVPTSVLAADFDGDGKADPVAVDSSGNWFYWHSSQSFSREGPIELGLSDLSPIA